jgi:uncharacterized C2H2 Zn-finger protein
MKIHHLLVLLIYQIVAIYVRLYFYFFRSECFVSFSVEAAGLDRYMNVFFDKQIHGDQSIRFPECPRCQKLIRHCQRYTPIINQIQLWIEEIKMNQQNGLTKSNLNQQRDEVLKNIKSSSESIKLIEQKYFDTLIRQLDNKKRSINIDELNYMKNTLEFFKEIK